MFNPSTQLLLWNINRNGGRRTIYCVLNWIVIYISWELSLIKELGFESTFINRKTINDTVIINDKIYKIPKIVLNNNFEKLSANDIKEALIFNKALIIENFISPNKLKFPLSRMTLEKYYFK